MQRRKNNKKKLVLGVTGSFGSGKTTVARFLQPYKAKVIDADKLARKCIRRASPIYKRIIAVFGKGILKKDRGVDRSKLAKIVFNNRNLLGRLNSIIHPEVIRAIKNKIKKSRSGLIVLDAPLLIEADLNKIVDKIIVVKASIKQQIKRAKKRDVLSSQDILKRIKSQVPLRKKLRLADFVIDNSGTLRKTKEQVTEIRRLLWKN